MNYKSIILSSSILVLALTGCSNEEENSKNDSTKSVEQSTKQSKNDNENTNKDSKNKTQSEVKSGSEKKQSEVDKVIKNMTDEQKKIAKEQAKREKSYGSPIYIPKEPVKKAGLNKHELIKVDDLQFKVVESNFSDKLNKNKAKKGYVFESITAEVRNLTGDIQNLANNEYYLLVDNQKYDVETITPFKIDKNKLELIHFNFQIPKDKTNDLNKQFIIKNKNNELKINL